MKAFTTLDAVVVAGYMLLIAVVASSFYRRHTTAGEYFLGSRSMSWLPVGISIIAADLSAITVMGSPAWSYGHNLELVWNTLGYPIAAPIVILVFVPFYTKLNLYTAYEYLERRFDLRVRLVASLLFLMLRSLHVSVVIYAPSLVINLVTGLPVWQCILFMGLFTTVYTTLGGIKAVIWTDVIQFGAVTSGILLVFVIAATRVPGTVGEALGSAAAAGRLNWLNLSLNPSELTSIWTMVLGGVVLCLGPLTTDQAVLQRMFTTRSSEDCRRSIIVQSVLVAPISLLLSFAGIALFVFYQAYPERLAGLTNTDAILPFFAIHELPSGVSGLIVACIFSASMAVMSAGINSLTTASTVDFYRRLFRKDASEYHYANAGRLGTIGWGLAVTLLALNAGRLGELALAYNKVSSFLTGPMLGIFLLGTLTRRANAAGVLAGVGAGAATVWFVTASTNWSFFLFGPIGVAVTFTAGLAASLLFPRPEDSHLRGLVVGYGDPSEAANRL